jgi:5-methylcytosine-specific restriction protein B
LGWNDDLRAAIDSRWQPGDIFSLADIYALEPEFQTAHPDNHHIREKLRQTLQRLRDQGVIVFVNPGQYRLLGDEVMAGGVRLESLYWKRLDSTTWHVLRGLNTQATGGGNHHVAVSARLPLEAVVGEFNPPSTPEARQAGSVTVSVQMPDGSSRQLEVAVDIRGITRKEILFRRQFGEPQALPLWFTGAQAAADPDSIPDPSDRPILYLVRGNNGILVHGFADPEELASWPSAIRDAISAGGAQGVISADDLPGYVEPGTTLAEVLAALDEERNVLLYGPPGTGKTHLMTAIWRTFQDGWHRITVNPTSKPQVVMTELADRWATFHPSYSYETFVAGYTPKPSGQGFSLLSQPGPALEATEAARYGGVGLLLVDELNRGNASRILGELVTVLERDKRLLPSGMAGPTTIPVRLANIDETTVVQLDSGPATVPTPFEMPDDVYFVGSMNSVDRTVAPLDAAVRRRFRVVELRPDLPALRARLGASSLPVSGQMTTAAEWGELAVALLGAVNRRIAHLAGPEFEVGHGYLWRLGDLSDPDARREALVLIWTEKIFPQLEETFRTRPDALAAAIRLGSPSVPAQFPYVIVEPPLTIDEAGGIAFIEPRPWGTNGGAHATWFRWLAEVANVASSAGAVTGGTSQGGSSLPPSPGSTPGTPAPSGPASPADGSGAAGSLNDSADDDEAASLDDDETEAT